MSAWSENSWLTNVAFSFIAISGFMLLIQIAEASAIHFSRLIKCFGWFWLKLLIFSSLSLIKVFLYFSSLQWLKNVSLSSTSCFNLSYLKMSISACLWFAPNDSYLRIFLLEKNIYVLALSLSLSQKQTELQNI